MGVQTTQALAIGAGIGGLSRIWLAAWMGTLPDRNSVEMAGAVCVGVGVFEPETRDRRRWAARARYGSLHPSGARLLSLSRRIIPWQLSRCSRSQTRGDHGQGVPITTLESDEAQEFRPCWTSPAERREVGLFPSKQPDSGISVLTLSVRGRSRAAACVCTLHLSSLGQAAAWCRLRPPRAVPTTCC